MAAFVVVGTWVGQAVAWPEHVNLRSFDAVEVGRAESAMWRSYYEKRPARLFWQLAGSLRTQYHIGFVRSFAAAYHAAKAAFVFKDGRTRAEYAKALPELERYFESLNAIAAEPFSAKWAAHNELEWWIIRREPAKHTTTEWAELIAEVASAMYHVPSEQLADYARLRVEAMVLRDQRGARITGEDWRRISALLEQSWIALANVVRSDPGRRADRTSGWGAT